MARFLKQPQQQLIQMGSPIDVDFYSRLLEKDQQNRNQAVGMQMEYIDKINNLPIYTEADRAATSGKVQDRLAKMLDKSFITPTQMARTVMELNQEITPGIQALKAKDQAAKLYDDMRVKYGANALMGTDPRNIDIADASGRYRDPGSYRALGVNLEDIDKRFLISQGANLTKNMGISYIQGKGINVNGVPEGIIQSVEKEGLSSEDITRLYAPGTQLAKEEATKQLQTTPELLEIFNNDADKAIKFLMDRNYQTAMAKGQEVKYGTLSDQTYVDAETRARAVDNKTGTGDNGGDVIYRDPKISPELEISSEINNFKKEVLDYYKINQEYRGLNKEQVSKKYEESVQALENFGASETYNTRIKSKLKKIGNTLLSLASKASPSYIPNFKLIMKDAEIEEKYQEELAPLLENMYLAGKVKKAGTFENLETDFSQKSNDFFSTEKYGAVSEVILNTIMQENPNISINEATELTLDKVNQLETGITTPVKKALTTEPSVLKSLHVQLVSSSNDEIVLNPLYNSGEIDTKENLSPQEALTGNPTAVEYDPGKQAIILTMEAPQNKGYSRYAIGKGSNISKLTANSMEALKDYSDALNSVKGMSRTKYINPSTGKESNGVATIITMAGDRNLFEIVRDVNTGESTEYILSRTDNGGYRRERLAYPGEITNYYIQSALGKSGK